MKRRIGAGSGIAFALLAVCVQASAGDRLPAVASASGSRPQTRTGRIEILREIVDPATGNRWLLERGGDRSGGPARLVLAGKVDKAMGGGAGLASKLAADAQLPVIRAGNTIVLVAHTAVLDSWVEAVALTAAPAGSSFRARLKIGGRIVAAIALGPGQAQWAPENQVQP